jgi:hypothetical protein
MAPEADEIARRYRALDIVDQREGVARQHVNHSSS